jgi:hypothetical protein
LHIADCTSPSASTATIKAVETRPTVGETRCIERGDTNSNAREPLPFTETLTICGIFQAGVLHKSSLGEEKIAGTITSSNQHDNSVMLKKLEPWIDTTMPTDCDETLG